MFKLIKLAIYGVIAYALYEMYLGFTEGGSQQGQGFGASMRRAGAQAADAMNQAAQNMTGPGEGMTTETSEASGMSSRHQVGRGVV